MPGYLTGAKEDLLAEFLRSLRGRVQHLRSQRASGSTSDEEPNALHYEEAQAEGERNEERGGATAGAKVSRVQLQGRSRGQAGHRAQGPGPLQAPHPRDHATGQKRQHADDNRGVGSVYAGLAQLFRLLRDTRSAGLPHPLDPTATASGSVAAVENTTSSPSGPDRAGGSAAAGEQHRRQRSWSLVSGPVQGSLRGPLQCLLQIARPSDLDRRLLA